MTLVSCRRHERTSSRTQCLGCLSCGNQMSPIPARSLAHYSLSLSEALISNIKILQSIECQSMQDNTKIMTFQTNITKKYKAHTVSEQGGRSIGPGPSRQRHVQTRRGIIISTVHRFVGNPVLMSKEVGSKVGRK